MRVRTAAAAIAATAVIALLAAPGTVSAHAGLEASVPAASAVLEESPDQIVLDFDEPIESAGASIELFDVAGTSIALGEPALSSADSSILAADAPGLDDGTYAVVWRIVSEDGHVIDGAFSFQIGTASAADAGDLLDRVGGGGGGDRLVSRTYGVARGLAYLGTALLLGGGLLLLLAPEVAERRRSLLLVKWGAVLAVVSTVCAFGMYAATVVAGGIGDAFDEDAWSTAIDTRTGNMIFVRLVALVVLCVLALTWRRSTESWWIATAAFAAVVTVATFPASGHPGATSPSVLWIAIGAVHVAGGLLWIGGLIVMAVGGLAAARRFSIVSTIAIPAVVVTGVVQTLELVDDLDDLTATAWGRVLLVKIAIVVVALSIAGVSRSVVVHAHGTHLRRTVVSEACLGAAVLALAAGLVALPPTPEQESQVFTATLAEAGLIADVTVTPGRVGSNDVHLVVTPPGASITPVESLEAWMSLPSRDIPASPVTITSDGPNHFTGTITLPFSGDWTLELVVEVTPGSTTLVKTTVPIP